jgi:hypothetical protein
MQENEKLPLDKKFASERDEWTKKIEKFSYMLSDIKQLADLQVSLYSAMGFIADYKRTLSNIYSKNNYKIRGRRFEIVDGIYKTQERFTAKDKEYFLEGSL